MKKNAYAVVLINQNPNFLDDGIDILTPQLFRTTKYCLKKDLVILDTFVMHDYCDNTPFYEMINFINDFYQNVAVVLDGGLELQILDFNKIVMLDLLLNLGKIEIHLVKENVSITDTKKQNELKLWSQYTNTNPKRMKNIRDGIYLTRDLNLNLENGIRVNLS